MPEYDIKINDQAYTVKIGRISDQTVEVTLNDRTFQVEVEFSGKTPSKTPRIERLKKIINTADVPDRTSPPSSQSSSGGGNILAPLPGLILKVLVKEGDSVEAGQHVVVMEAMKMENEIESHVSGRVSKVEISEGDNVLENAVLIRIGS